jgi:hypothetical protein
VNIHVYNLQTKYDWYICNNIITHNCRCEFEYQKASDATNEEKTQTTELDAVNEKKDPENINEYYNQFSTEMQKEFGLNDVNLEFVKGQGFPEYDRENNNVTLPGFLEGKPVSEIKKIYSDLDQTIYHEFGHAVQSKIISGMSDVQFDEYTSTIYSLIEKLGYPTEYSKKNRNEWISERFALEKTKELDKILIPILKGFIK